MKMPAINRTFHSTERYLLRTVTTKAKDSNAITTNSNVKVKHKRSRILADSRGWILGCGKRVSKYFALLTAIIFLTRTSAVSTTATTTQAANYSEGNLENLINSTMTTTTTTTTNATRTTGSRNAAQYSQPSSNVVPAVAPTPEIRFEPHDGGFRPMIPRDALMESISRNVFTPDGQYRVFQPTESDLRAITTKFRQQKPEGKMGATDTRPAEDTTQSHPSLAGAAQDEAIRRLSQRLPQDEKRRHSEVNLSTALPVAPLDSDVDTLEELLMEYMQNFFTKGQYEPKPELIAELQKQPALMASPVVGAAADLEELDGDVKRSVRHVDAAAPASNSPSPSLLAARTDDDSISRAMQGGRLLFLTGLKKVMWPVFVGLQILKSLLFAMLLPTLIGSFGKLVSKGLTSASIRPMEAPQDLDFRDNTFNFDEENNKFIVTDDGGKDNAAYPYNQQEASQAHYTTYNVAANNNNNNNNNHHQGLSRYGVNEKQLQRMPDSYMSALQSISAASFKNSGSLSSGTLHAAGGGGGGGGGSLSILRKPVIAANTNNFQAFQKVPASSLLLSNYDPFYSPLLSRLDSVFAQLKLNSENEVCREKLICLMYSNPAKYAPYSNLVSAQLSRELNELRKPTSDNPDILRFFKYMRAAKDGQDGIDCETTFEGCKEFKDFENPAMVSTYHDINKLVQARKIN